MGATASGNVATSAEKQSVFIIQSGATRNSLKCVRGAGAAVTATLPDDISGGVLYAIFTPDPAAGAVTDEAGFDPVGLSPGDVISVFCNAAHKLELKINDQLIHTSVGVSGNVADAVGALYYYK
tara:strand:+ start:434 stop:805 length:372 start_codon:yes stop_codon:yes gene_type:complete